MCVDGGEDGEDSLDAYLVRMKRDVAMERVRSLRGALGEAQAAVDRAVRLIAIADPTQEHEPKAGR